MARQFLTLTQEEIDAKLAETIKSRELELLAYDFEKENHKNVIASLGDIAWDETNEKYKGLQRDQMIVRAYNDGLSDNDIQLISDLMTLDSHKMNLAAVKIETVKSERHYDNTLSQLPEGARRDAAFSTLISKDNSKV